MFKIRECRERAGLSQKEVSIELGVSVQAVSHWENGVRWPNLETTVKLCDLYHCTADEILGRTSMDIDIKKETPPPLGEGEQEFVIDLDGSELPGSEFEKRVLQILSQELDRRGI